MEKAKKFIRNFILFILIIILTFYIVLKDQNIDEIWGAVTRVNVWYIFIAIICMLIYLSLEAVNMGRTLRALKEKSNFFKNLRYAYIGFFFSAITPAASGGQPMQVYFMHKDKITVANSTLALLINLCSFQLITIPLAIICLCFEHTYLNTSLMWLFLIGIALNSCALALLLIGIFSRRMSLGLVNFAVKIMKFFKVKKIEEKEKKISKELLQYHGNAKYFRQHKKLMAKTLITTLIQILVYYSIPYWVYLSFGFNELNIIEMIALQAILYATVSGIPLPGAVGVSEGGFLGIFKNVFTAEKVNGAMLINRGISFYLFVLISGVVVIVNMFRNKDEVKKDIFENKKQILKNSRDKESKEES